MGGRKGLIRKLFIFMLIMGFISLAFMLLNNYMSHKNQMYIDADSIELVQLEAPEDGDTIAVIETSLGEIRAVLYPEYSPNAVRNFIELAESGYYDNTYVFQSESGAYSAAGAKLKDGTMPDGYDTSHELIERELNQNLWPFKGAVCVMNTTVDRSFTETLFGGGTYYNGSRFALINTIEFTDEVKQELIDSSESEELSNAFIEKGGVPNFSQQMTVIGQAYEGLDVIEQLASLEADNNGTYKIPKDDVMIVSVEIGEYSADIDAGSNESSD